MSEHVACDFIKCQDRAAVALLIERCHDLMQQRDQERAASMKFQAERDDARQIGFSYLARLKHAGAADAEELPPWAFEP